MTEYEEMEVTPVDLTGFVIFIDPLRTISEIETV